LKTGVRFPAARLGIFLLDTASETGPGFHTTSYPMGTRGSFPGINRPGREAYHSPPSSAGVMNPPIRLHGVVLN